MWRSRSRKNRKTVTLPLATFTRLHVRPRGRATVPKLSTSCPRNRSSVSFRPAAVCEPLQLVEAMHGRFPSAVQVPPDHLHPRKGHGDRTTSGAVQDSRMLAAGSPGGKARGPGTCLCGRSLSCHESGHPELTHRDLHPERELGL